MLAHSDFQATNHHRHQHRYRAGFTLVEILVTIVIIGILAGIALPAITGFIATGRETVLKLEIESISQALENYNNEYGDYPPDMSSWTTAQRHLRKAFPRISAVDITLLYNMCHQRNGSFTQLAPSPAPNDPNAVFQPSAIDRSEALVLFLGGLSDDASRPFTGPGGPFEQVRPPSSNESLATPGIYQYNISRDNVLFEMDEGQLTLAEAQPNQPLYSNDEEAYSLPVDLIPAYKHDGREAPFLYFDSRNYGGVAGLTDVYNGYWHPEFGGIRPYKDNVGVNANPTYGTQADASLASWKWAEPKSFQIISAGADDLFGTAIWFPLGNDQTPTGVSSAASPLYFIAETGRAMGINPSATSFEDTLDPNLRAFQEESNVNGAEENGHLDNITNFSGTTLENDLET